jgi:microcystin-dependent protein
MTEPFLAEIRLMSFSFAPKGWALCDGQLLPINQNQALFSLLGTTYGGDGRVNFALPDLRGRGERSGEQSHTLSTNEIPTHTHVLNASPVEANTPAPGNDLLARTRNEIYAPLSPSNNTPMAAGAVTNAGGSQAHLNMQPFLTLNFCIALQGIFPSQN